MDFIKNIFGKKELVVPSFSSLVNQFKYHFSSSHKSADLLKEYKNWVYACINARAEELASIELILKKKGSDEVIESSDVLTLLNDVNPNSTKYDLFFGTQAFLDLTGNAFWYLVRDTQKKIRQIYLLSPDKMSIVTSKDNALQITGYVWTNGREQIPFTPEDIIHFKNFNPSGNQPAPHKGVGVVQGALWAIETDNEARTWNYSFFKNSAKPDGILTTESAITDAQFTRMKDQWNQAHRGSDNNGKTAILENGLKWQDISKTQKDMDFIAQRTFSRDEILSLFRVPKTVVGITDDVNRANAEASDYVFARRTIKPLMKSFVTVLNEYLLPYFDTNLYFEFEDPTPEDRLAEIQEYTNGFGKWLSRNDIRREEGLTPSENGDVFYSQFSEVVSDNVVEPVQKTAQRVSAKTKVDKTIEDFIATLPKKKTLRRLSVGQKDMYKDSYLKRFDANEKALIKDVKAYFADQEKEVLENLEQEYRGLKPKEYKLKGVNDVIFDKQKALATGISLITPHIRKFLSEGAEMADAFTGGTYNPNSPEALNFIKERAKFFSESINDTTATALVSSINEGVKAGEGFEDIKARIENIYKDAEAYRTDAIARTEVSASLNTGAVDAYKQAGVNSLEWVAILDDTTSDECQQNDGEIREIGKSFPAGADRPPQHVNCRCSVVAVFED